MCGAVVLASVSAVDPISETDIDPTHERNLRWGGAYYGGHREPWSGQTWGGAGAKGGTRGRGKPGKTKGGKSGSGYYSGKGGKPGRHHDNDDSMWYGPGYNPGYYNHGGWGAPAWGRPHYGWEYPRPYTGGQWVYVEGWSQPAYAHTPLYSSKGGKSGSKGGKSGSKGGKSGLYDDDDDSNDPYNDAHGWEGDGLTGPHSGHHESIDNGEHESIDNGKYTDDGWTPNPSSLPYKSGNGVSVIAMEYLPIVHVRTDPVMTQQCLSDHVHTHYGPPMVHPAVAYNELRGSTSFEATSGNVLENQSLYWHPTFYQTKGGLKHIVEPDWTSIYYAYEKGKARAFPKGFQMIGSVPSGLDYTCYNSGEVSDKKGRKLEYGEAVKFPTESCGELAVAMVFPSCWDGTELGTQGNHQDHMTYAISLESGTLDTFGAANTKCPASHPIKVPQIMVYLRFANYGNDFELANGGEDWHADYYMGWDEDYLQKVLDECDVSNDIPCGSTRLRNIHSSASGPSSWSDEGKELRDKRVSMCNTSCITDEKVDEIAVLRRGECTGTMFSVNVCKQERT